MFHRIKEVVPLRDYQLVIVFESGEKKIYNVHPLFAKWDAFQSLATVKGLFDQVKVDTGGYGISWNDEIDLSCNELYHNGVSL